MIVAVIPKLQASTLTSGSSSPSSGGLAVQRKYRRRRQQQHIRRMEYRKLKSVLPSIAHRQSVTKVTVVEEAILYIDELHNALSERLKAGEHFQVPDFVLNAVAASSSSSSSSAKHPLAERTDAFVESNVPPTATLDVQARPLQAQVGGARRPPIAAALAGHPGPRRAPTHIAPYAGYPHHHHRYHLDNDDRENRVLR